MPQNFGVRLSLVAILLFLLFSFCFYLSSNFKLKENKGKSESNANAHKTSKAALNWMKIAQLKENSNVFQIGCECKELPLGGVEKDEQKPALFGSRVVMYTDFENVRILAPFTCLNY